MFSDLGEPLVVQTLIKDTPKQSNNQVSLNKLFQTSSNIQQVRPGVHPTVYYFGENNSIKLLMLPKSRKNATESKRSNWVYESIERKLSGEEIAWVQKEITNSKAIYTIVASDIQIQADQRYNVHMESVSRDAILSAWNRNTNILFISGDEHYGEVLSDPCSVHLHGYLLKEFTSTGLSHMSQKEVYSSFGSLYYMVWNYFVQGFYNLQRDRTTERNIGALEFHIDNEQDSKFSFQLFDKRGRTVVKERYDRQYFE